MRNRPRTLRAAVAALAQSARRDGYRSPGGCVAEAAPSVVSRDVDVCPVRLLRAGWCSPQVDVRTQQVLDADEVAGRELEDQKLVGGSSVREAGSSRKRRQTLARWRA